MTNPELYRIMTLNVLKTSDRIPYVSDLGSCPECKRFEESQTSTPEDVRICPCCKRRWWKYNNVLKLWKQVVSPEEWNTIRANIVSGK